MRKLAHLPDRAVLAVAGEDRISFLQGLVSNDVALVAPGHPVWAALLTAQGKYVADFFIRTGGADTLLLECAAETADEVATKLARYRLRARVVIERVPLAVHAAWDPAAEDRTAEDGAAEHGTAEAGLDAQPDPRLPQAGSRVLAPNPLAGNAPATEYDLHRLELGLPDGAPDLEPGRSVLLEAGFDELGGVSWTKGCYMGQELTARTRYRGLIKRRLVPVSVTAGALPPPGTALFAAGAEAGTMRSGRDGQGLATLRLEHLAGALTTPDGAHLAARVPPWMRLPETRAAE